MSEDIEMRCVSCISKGHSVAMEKRAEGHLWCPLCGDARWPHPRPPKPSERLMQSISALGAPPDLASAHVREALERMAHLAAEHLGEDSADAEHAAEDAEVNATIIARQVQASREAGVPYSSAMDLIAEQRFQRWRAEDVRGREMSLENQRRGIAAEERIAAALEQIVALMRSKEAK